VPWSGCGHRFLTSEHFRLTGAALPHSASLVSARQSR
jgi:hypothetical protein